MSQPKRYDCGMTEESSPSGIINRWPLMHSHPAGKYVLHSDYAALAAENERLKAIIVDECYGSDAYRKHENEAKRLTAENERLRKAGDAMAKCIQPPAHGPGEYEYEYDAWFAAKEGKSV